MLENQIDLKSRVHVEPAGEKISIFQKPSEVYSDSQIAVKDFESAYDKLGEIQPSKNGQIDTLLINAKLLVKHKEHSLALGLLRQACKFDSFHVETLQLLAFCLEKVGKIEEALIVYKNLIKVDFGFETLSHLGSIYYKLGQDKEALEKYDQALAAITEENDYLFEVFKNMGNIFVRQGDFDAAEEFYNKAYTICSESDVLLVNLGTLEVQRNDYNKALYCFRKAVELNVANDKAWVGLAMVHNQLGDGELAWANIERAIDTNPKNRTAIHLAANWGVRDGKIVNAIETLQNYLGTVEQDEDMSMVLINLFCMVGQYAEALLEIERVLLWNPSHVEVRQVKKQIQQLKKAA